MRVLRSLLIPMILTPLLTGCNEKQPLGAALGNRDDINRSLAPRCPTEGQLTPAQLTALSARLRKKDVPELAPVAAEYDRLDDEAIACRNGKSE